MRQITPSYSTGRSSSPAGPSPAQRADRPATVKRCVHRYQGMIQILRFNWPWYVAACASAWILFNLKCPPWLKPALGAGVAPGVLWLVVSLLVSHWVYDLSPLRQWTWLRSLIIATSGRAANIHAGLEQIGDELPFLFPDFHWLEWDIYEPRLMTEGSIRRARAERRAKSAVNVDFKRLPAQGASLNALLLIFSAHELRSAAAREAFFGEVSRILKPGGTIVLVEHLRDLRNFLAYGPGVWHFLPRKEWLRLAGGAGLRVSKEFTITPFVTIFCLTRTSEL